MQDLRVTLAQVDLLWQQPAANRARFEQLLAPLAGETDLVVLPEMFTTGFTMSPETVAEPEQGETVAWMRDVAQHLNAAVTGSVATRQTNGAYCNRLVWMQADGQYAEYDKRHLFRMANEHRHYAAGNRRLMVELKGWRLCPLVCYDLRFPAWSRNAVDIEQGYDVLIYVANWPERRRYAWQSLLPARAIENLSYCIGVNRVGVDGNEIAYAGDSAALDFMGRPLVESSEAEHVTTLKLNYAALKQFRYKFPAYLDADRFELR